MDFGIFLEQTRRGNNQDEAFRDMFALAEASETWGLDIIWLAEMMVNPARSVLSAPLLMASWIASRTKRVRTGTAVQLLPLNHPLRVAGEVTMLDHLSQGRFDFGIGRSGGPRAYDALGVAYEESQDRFFEALEIIMTAFKGGLSATRAAHRFANVAWAAAVSKTAPAVPDGRDDARDIPHGWPRWDCRSSWAAGHEHPRAGGAPEGLSRRLARGRTPGRRGRVPAHPALRAPRPRPREKSRRNLNLLLLPAPGRLTRQPLGAPARPGRAAQRAVPAVKALSYEEILETKVAFGTAPALIDRLTERATSSAPPGSLPS